MGSETGGAPREWLSLSRGPEGTPAKVRPGGLRQCDTRGPPTRDHSHRTLSTPLRAARRRLGCGTGTSFGRWSSIASPSYNPKEKKKTLRNLETKVRTLRLADIIDVLHGWHQKAIHAKLVYVDLLELLFDDDLTPQKGKLVER